MRFPHDSVPVTRMTSTGSTTFSLTATTMTSEGGVFDVAAADIDPATGVARTLYLLRRPGTDEHCIDAISFTKR